MGVSGENHDEGRTNDSKLVDLQSILNVSKSICKIETPYNIAIGFLIIFFKDTKDFYCLMTNEHIINKELINNKEKIIFYYNNGAVKKEIYLNKNERFIKDFRDINIDATVVEIIPEDNINKKYFLYPLIEYDYNKSLNKEISIIQYPEGKLSYSNGIIKKINNYEFSHLARTDSGSSGSPIFFKDSIKVIGIHKSSKNNKTENYGILLDLYLNILIIIKN